MLPLKNIVHRRAPAGGRGWLDAFIARKGDSIVVACLLVLVWAVFGQSVNFDFINFDDNEYVYDNPAVSGGLSLSGIAWAFTHVWAANWHPLTWIAHMADAQLYGLHPGGHHAGNVLLHALSAALLFLALREMTGAFWRCVFVSAIFAIHPQRAESVAWISERKDVLSGVFFMLTLGAYMRYARTSSKAWYTAVVVFFTLGLLAKPSIVTLPFVLLLLDFWPLGRFKGAMARRIVLEKLPLFLLAAASCVATILAQTNAIMSIEHLPMRDRLANAAWAYILYLRDTVYPANLALQYPLVIPPWWAALPAALALAGISLVAVRFRNRQPWIAVGWFWFLGVLAPMIGILQVGAQGHADRYSYLSQIGLLIAGAWTLSEWSARFRHGLPVTRCAAALAVAVCVVSARAQVGYWRDSETLWQRTLACTQRNSVAHNGLAMAYSTLGRDAAAFSEFQKALSLSPNDAYTNLHLAVYLTKAGNLDEGILRFRQSLRVKPRQSGTETDLGMALADKGRITEAKSHFRTALELDPDFVPALNDLAWVLTTRPWTDADQAEALSLAQRANKLSNGQNADVLDTLASVYAGQGRFAEAIRTTELAMTKANPALRANLQKKVTQYKAGQSAGLPDSPTPWR